MEYSAVKKAMEYGSLKALGVCTLAIGLVACGGDDDDPVVTDENSEVNNQGGTGADSITFDTLSVHGLNGVSASEISSSWVLDVFMFNNGFASGNGTLEAGPINIPGGLVLQDTIDFRNGEVTADTCEIFEDDGVDGGGGGNSPNYVSAGSFITINTPSGTVVDVSANVDGTYSIGDLQDLPAGAYLSVPGDVFPTVSSYPLQTPATPVRLSPQPEATVGLDTEYRWQPDTDPNTYTRMVFTQWDASGVFLGFSNTVACEMVDDGTFEIPDEVLGHIAGSENNWKVRFETVARRLDHLDGVVFYQESRVAGSW